MSSAMSDKTRKSTDVKANQSADVPELSEDELDAIYGGVRKSAGN